MGKVSNQPVDEAVLLRNHIEFKRKIEEKIDERLKSWLEMGWGGEYKSKLLETLEKDYK